jgi:hypothetical protein
MKIHRYNIYQDLPAQKYLSEEVPTLRQVFTPEVKQKTLYWRKSINKPVNANPSINCACARALPYPSLHILGILLSNLLQVVHRNLTLLFVVAGGVERSQDLHGLVVAGLRLQHLLEALGRIFHVTTVDVHLTQPKVGQHKAGSCKLGCLHGGENDF